MVLGGGFDVLSNAVHAGCLDLKGLAPARSTTPGQDATFELKAVEHSAELAESMQISASGSLQMGAYSGDAKASFAASHAVNSSSVYIVASVIVEDRTDQFDATALQKFELNPAVVDLYKNNPYGFRSLHGSHFVSGQVFGGELYCIVEIQTDSTSDKMSLDVSASGSGDGVKIAAAFQGALESATKNRTANVWIHKVGGAPLHLGKDDMTVDAFITMAGGFAAEVAAQPMPYTAILTPYEELTGLPSVPQADTLFLDDAVGALTDRFLQYRDALADLQYLSDHAVEFVYPKLDDATIASHSDSVTQAQHTVAHELAYYTSGVSLDEKRNHVQPTLPTVTALMAGLPQRRAKLPTSAADVREMYPEAPDGNYDLYLGGLLSGHIVLYCHNMSTAPAEYLTLAPSVSGNRSYWPASTSDGQRWREGTDMTTAYSRIRIFPADGTVDLTDNTFSTTLGGPLIDKGADGSRSAPIHYANYATASASNHNLNANTQPRTPFSTTWVDLRGTPLRFADGVNWKVSGWDAKAASNPLTPNPADKGKVMVATVGGAPGNAQPMPLQLTLDTTS
jgi:hypothetical protein